MTTATARSLQLRRLIRADRETVFAAWTRPEHLRRWACPEGYDVPEVEVDLRVGGQYRIHMKSPEGTAPVAFGTYERVEVPSLLVYSWDWEGDMGGLDSTVTVEFHDRDGATEVVLTHEGFPTEELMRDHEQGWSSCVDKLEALFV